jgi:enhancer of mRNA-decapping protein 3
VQELAEVPAVSQSRTQLPAATSNAGSSGRSADQSTKAVAENDAPRAPFVDPAILSIGKRPEVTAKREPVVIQARAPISQLRPDASVRPADDGEDSTPTAEAAASVKHLKIEAVPLETKQDGRARSTGPARAAEDPTAVLPAPPTGPKKKRRPRRGKDSSAPRLDQDDAVSTISETRGKGWRQTPILQSSASFQPFKSLTNAGRGRRANQKENGWASEDATDVQEAGDFDFDGGLAKFDKKGLFDQMRKDDKTDDADRLVSHNRQTQPKPGTAGGRNLHYTENVLDLPVATSTSRHGRDAISDNFWNSEADDGLRNGGERLSGRDQGSRQSSRRGDSKATTTRRSQSRKASAVAVGQGPARVNSGVSKQAAALRSCHLAILPELLFTNATGTVPGCCAALWAVSAAVRPQSRDRLGVADAQPGEHCAQRTRSHR